MSSLAHFEFNSTDEPLPLQVAAKWAFPLTYIHTDSGETLYSIQDWINGLSSSDQSRLLWAKMKNQLLLSIQQLPYLASNGATYQMDFTDANGLYRIAQELRSTKKRPALKDIKTFLAAAGVFIEAALRDPEGHKAWIDTRTKGKAARNALTATWQDRGAVGKDFADLTEHVNQMAIGKKSTAVRKELGLKPNAPIRNHMTAQELAQLNVAEGAAMALHIDRDSQGTQQLDEDIADTRPVMDALRSLLGKRRR